MNVLDRYIDALTYFSKESNYLAIQICKLGYPEISKDISTAAVAWDQHKKRVKFLFNDKFQESLSDEEFRFVLSHEAVHLLNNHILLLKDKIDWMKSSKVENEQINKFCHKYNIAADCVVNDSLTVLYGFNKIRTENTPESGKIIYGQDYVGMSCHDMAVMDVFNMIEDEKVFGKESNLDSHDWSSFFESNGSLKKEFVDQIKEFISRNSQNSNLSDKEASVLESIKNNLKKIPGFSDRAGNTSNGNYRPIDGLTKVGIAWNKFFFQLVERKTQETIWNKPNRKLISSYPEILSPSLQNEEKEDIFIAIDSSGSIDYNALSLFVSVVKNIPKSFNIKAISFDTQCYEWDHKGGEQPRGGGGTNFGIIEDYLQGLKKYPKAVFVLTDGYGSEVSPQYDKRWCFVLYGGACKDYCKNMKSFNIESLLV